MHHKQLKSVALSAALVLCLATAAEAQTIARVTLLTNPVAGAREGGKMEASGDIFLSIEGVADSVAGIVLTYSAPVAGDTANITLANVSLATTPLDSTKKKLSLGAPTGATVTVRNVMLDVSGSSGAVTVQVALESAEEDLALLVGADTANVITEIQMGLTATAKMSDTVRTRGTPADGVDATLTIKEGFKDAFMAGDMLSVELSGIPTGATVSVEGPTYKTTDDDGNDLTGADLAAVPMLAVSPGSVTGEAGEDKTVELTLGSTVSGSERAAPSEFDLTLTFVANPEAEMKDLTFPLAEGMVAANATFKGDNFVAAKTADATVFMIRPAQCILLFPTVAYLPDLDPDWDTAFSVTNPGYVEDPISGMLEFTLYSMTGEMMEKDSTDLGVLHGVDGDGDVAAGGSAQFLASDLVDSTFRGQLRVVADYPDCNGLGWVTNFIGVNQAYPATVIDADTGDNN